MQVKNVMTGESVEWTHVHTILFLYMQDRYKHFKNLGKEFYDNQEDIAQETGIPLRSLSRKMKELYRIGAVRAEKKKIGGYLKSNAYTVLDVFSVPMFEAVTADGEVLEKFAESGKETPKKFKNEVVLPAHQNGASGSL